MYGAAPQITGKLIPINNTCCVLDKRWRQRIFYLSALNEGKIRIASTRSLAAGLHHQSNFMTGCIYLMVVNLI